MKLLIVFTFLWGILCSVEATDEDFPKEEPSSSCSTLELDGFHPTCGTVIQEPLFLSSITVQTCETQSRNPCGCILAGFCEYNVTTEECVKKENECNYELWKDDECRRAGNHVFYAIGGVICNSNTRGGICQKEDTILAINFNGKEHVDINSIYYLSGWHVAIEDPDKTVLSSSRPQAGVPQHDLELYNTQIYGRHENQKLRCATIKIPYKYDGHYELSIKTGQTVVGIKERNFRFLLNGQKIVAEFKPTLYRAANESLDLNINFVIYSKGTYLKMMGQVPSKLTDPNNIIPFSLCYGTCNWPNLWSSWVIDALSVIKFTTEVSCSVNNNNPCLCLQEDKCEYSVTTDQCIAKESACSGIYWNPSFCRRSGDHVFYSIGGIVCRSTQSMGNCKMKNTIVAVNFNSQDHIDIHGIHFLPESSVQTKDPHKTRHGYKQTQFGVPEADNDLYSSIIYGKAVKGQDTKCFVVPVKLEGDGHYEISIKTGQITEWNINRDFTYKFNGMHIVKEFKPRRYRDNDYAFDINIHFTVFNEESQLAMEGYPVTNIPNAEKIVDFELCFGTCVWNPVTIEWHIGALSIVKFDQPLTCATFINDVCGCIRSEDKELKLCGFNVITGECTEQTTACSRSTWDSKQCRRAGPHIFYSEAGLICSTVVQTGNCAIKDTMAAVNFNGEGQTDSYGIHFKGENDPTAPKLYDPENAIGRNYYSLMGVPTQDVEIYNSLVFGNKWNQDGMSRCNWVDD